MLRILMITMLSFFCDSCLLLRSLPICLYIYTCIWIRDGGCPLVYHSQSQSWNTSRGSGRKMLVDNLNGHRRILEIWTLLEWPRSEFCGTPRTKLKSLWVLVTVPRTVWGPFCWLPGGLSRLEKPDRMFMSVKTKGIHHHWVFPTLIDPKQYRKKSVVRYLSTILLLWSSTNNSIITTSRCVWDTVVGGETETQSGIVSLSFNSEVLLEFDRNHVCEFL